MKVTTVVTRIALGSSFALALLVGVSAHSAVVIDFESPADGTILTTEYSAQGVNFSGAAILNESGTLNPEFPPHSGNQVVYDYLDGTITASAVGSLWSSAGGYITGNTAITLEAYDSANNLLGSVSTSGANYIGSGNDNPNIFLNVQADGIAYVKFHDTGNTFTLDDFQFTPVPEPSTYLAGLGALGMVIGFIRSRKQA